MSQSNLRGHSLKLNKKRVRLDVAKFSFSNRAVLLKEADNADNTDNADEGN